jgi:hypothetical protein
MTDRPEWCPQDVWDATLLHAEGRADWLVDAVATSLQDRKYSRGDDEEDSLATEAIYLNGLKAIRVASARAIMAYHHGK